MDALLARHVTGWLFVAGRASNQGSFYDRFDAVVLLSVPREVMLQRIATRSINPFGKDAHERQRILATWRLWSRSCGPPRRLRL